jgi:hypothetical protein
VKNLEESNPIPNAVSANQRLPTGL